MNDQDTKQSDKFKDLARQIEADDDEAQWEARLKAVSRQKPKDLSPDKEQTGDEAA